jgi:hypothetical protein
MIGFQDLSLRADGNARSAISETTTGANGSGGRIDVLATGGGTVSARLIDVAAEGRGADGNQGQAGDGVGGNVSLGADGGTLIVAGPVFASASASAGSASSSTIGGVGSGLGGTARIFATKSGSVAINGDAAVFADGVSIGGSIGTGGRSELSATAGI